MPALLNLIGQRFGRLMVLGRAENRGQKVRWVCQCDCGKVSIAETQSLRRGVHRSCGCLQLETVTKHGATGKNYKSPEYATWLAMKARCLNPKHSHYARYGGRGITICARWLHSFESFLADMGAKPTPQHTIERIDNNGAYSPENCRWATRKEQAQNRINNPSPRSGPRDERGRFS